MDTTISSLECLHLLPVYFPDDDLDLVQAAAVAEVLVAPSRSERRLLALTVPGLPPDSAEMLMDMLDEMTARSRAQAAATLQDYIEWAEREIREEQWRLNRCAC